MLCSLNVGTRLPRPLSFNLSAYNGYLYSGVHSPVIGGEVGITVCGDQEQTTRFGSVDPVFELPKLASKTVEVIDHNSVNETRLVVLHHTQIGRALLHPITHRNGLIDVCLDAPPTANF